MSAEEKKQPIHPNEWEGFEVPSVTESNYGLAFPKGTSQLVIELACFKLGWDFKKEISDKMPGKVEEPFRHALRICQLLWAEKFVKIQDKATGALNTYFLDVLHDCCEFKDLAVTGPASAAKTYSCAIFMLICFYSNPSQFCGLISTTSGKGAERRVWGDVKKLHRNARFTDYEMPVIGEIVEYLSLIVFNPGAMFSNKAATQRDFRQGIMVIPVAADSTGDAALDVIMGTKQAYMCWMVDEGPAMPADIMAPRGNLVSNVFQFIMVGNANNRTDPHGRACEPLDGWKMLDPSVKRWEAATLDVLFLHGECSPNDYYGEGITKKAKLPFPYLSNAFNRKEMAKVYIKEGGINSFRYWRFGIGYWLGSDLQQTVLSENFVKMHSADQPPKKWGLSRPRAFAALDPGFTAGGDINSLTIIIAGTDITGKPQIVFPSASIEIVPMVTEKKDYAKAVAQEAVRQCKEATVNPQDFGGDVSSDGGITLNEVQNEWGLGGIQLLSSLEPSSLAKYANRVTQYWMGVRDLIATGYVRGFNIHSNYARDLFERRFVDDSRQFKVERKRDMKKRIMRSPDSGDSVSYCSYLVTTSGIISLDDDSVTEDRDTDEESIITRLFTQFGRKENPADDEYATAGFADEEW